MLKVGTPGKRVLFLNQFYWPDMAPTAVLLDDLARKFVAEGWDATVICSRTMYATGEDKQSPAVRILAVPAFPYTRKAAGRLLSWGSFLALATLRSFRAGQFDLVIAMTSPPGIALAGALLKLLRGSGFWIWEMDVYPDIALALSKSQKSLFGSLMSGVFRIIRRKADGILVLGPCMRRRLETHDISADRLHIADNWANGEKIRPLDIPSGAPLTVLYSGNLGLAHDTETIAGVLRRFAGTSDVSFVFSGGGARRAELERVCAAGQIRNVKFQGYASSSGFLSNLASCHLGLVTLRPECIGSVVPSKVYSFLAAGRPFIYIGPKDSTPALIAREGCGWSFENGDVEGISELLNELRANPSMLREASAQARLCFERRFNKPIGTARIFDLVTAASGIV